MNQGVTKLPRGEPGVKKMYFSIQTPNGTSNAFQRHADQLISLQLLHITLGMKRKLLTCRLQLYFYS